MVYEVFFDQAQSCPFFPFTIYKNAPKIQQSFHKLYNKGVEKIIAVVVRSGRRVKMEEQLCACQAVLVASEEATVTRVWVSHVLQTL